ncbi:MAG: type II toxin-antitoxin system Phd/YefM family antitoxin [Thermoanaerobaculia bacterium]
MRIASLAEVKAKLSAYLQVVETTGPVVITRNGKAVAILLAPVDDDDLERLLLSRSPRFQSLLAKSRASIRAGKGLTHAAFWRASAQPPVPDGGRESSARKGNGKRRARRG